MTTPSTNTCTVCAADLPQGRLLYCSDRCRQTAKMRRHRARRAGAETPAPEVTSRAAAHRELAHTLLSSTTRSDSVDREELHSAHQEVARLSRELADRTVALRNAQRALDEAITAKAKADRETRFVAVAFVRTVRAASISDRVPDPVRARVTAWIPEGENPWG